MFKRIRLEIKYFLERKKLQRQEAVESKKIWQDKQDKVYSIESFEQWR